MKMLEERRDDLQGDSYNRTQVFVVLQPAISNIARGTGQSVNFEIYNTHQLVCFYHSCNFCRAMDMNLRTKLYLACYNTHVGQVTVICRLQVEK